MSILVTNNNATQEGYEKESAEVMAEETSSIQLQHYQKKCRSQERLKKAAHAYVQTHAPVPDDC